MHAIKRYTLILFAAALAMPVSSVTADVGVKYVPVNLELVQTQFRTEQDVNGDGEVAFKLTSHYKGSPGRAESVGFSEVGFPLGDTSGCPEDYIAPFALPILIYEDTLVFNDLSMLFISGEGLLCFDFATFKGVAFVDADATGGTGRFAGASGMLHLDFPETWSTYLQYAVAAGTMSGTLEVPAD
jgi:hypothetical protein